MRTLHASERRGHVRRACQDRLRMPFAPSQADAAGYGQPAITWQLTPAGASYLATWSQAHGTHGDASASGVS